MTRQQWNGEELFSYDGKFIFIVQRVNSETMIIADYATGECETIPCQDFDSATPEELEEIV